MVLKSRNFISIRVLLILILILGSVGLFLIKFRSEKTFETQIQKCNATPKELRFTCYRSVIDKYFKQDLLNNIDRLEKSASNLFDQDSKTYAIFGTNCHTFYHGLGDFLANNQTNIIFCPDTCTGGCVMGFIKRKAYQANYDTDQVVEIYNSCPASQKSVCAHEMGHVFQDKYAQPVLKIVDEFSKVNNIIFKNETVYVPENESDENKAFEDCRNFISPEYLAMCYEGIGHNMFLFSEFSPGGYEASAQRCRNIDEPDRDQCYSFLAYRVGLNETAIKFTQDKFDEGKKECSAVVSAIGQDNKMKDCHYGLGRGLGLFLQSQYPHIDNLSTAETENFTKNMNYYSIYCRKLESEHASVCYKGLLSTIFKDYYSSLHLNIEEIELLNSADQLKLQD